MNDEGVSTAAEAEAKEEKKEERDFETPAFLRKKLLNG